MAALTKQDLRQALSDIPTRDEVRVIIREEVTKAVSAEMESRDLVSRDDLNNLATKQDLQDLADTLIQAIDDTLGDHVKKYHSSAISLAGV